MKTKFTLFIACVCVSLASFSQSYCSFVSAPYAPQQPGITNFQLGTINRTSANTEGNNALVLTGVTVTLTIGQTYSFSITSTNDVVNGAPLTGAPQSCRIYVDFNQNFNFTDPGETAFSYDYIVFTPTNAASATYTNAIGVTVPATVTPGTAKMRVTAKMGPSAGHTPPTPCNSPVDPLGYHGEMEEYTVVFVSATNANANFSVTPGICTNVAMTMTNNSTGSPTPTYTWSVNPAAAISNSNATNPTITFANAATYTVTLIATNASTTSTTTRTVSASVCSGISVNNLNTANITLAPNPFNQTTQLSYQLENTAATSLVIYNILGEKVFTLLNDEQTAGTHQITIDKNKFSKNVSGIYFVELTSGNAVYRTRIIARD